MKKILALVLALTLMCSAAYAEPGIGTLFDAAVQLAYKTHNVTLTGEAEFRYDGELFKTMHAKYQQDGVNSFLSYMLDTPKPDGSVYTGGFTVLGLGNLVYSNDTYFGNYYNTSAQQPSDTVLSGNAKVRSMLVLARSLAVACEPLEANRMDVNAEGTSYSFKVGDLPEYIDNAVYYLLADYINDTYYLNLFNDKSSKLDGGATAYYEDWDSYISGLYFTLFNEEMPTGELPNQKYERMSVVYTWAEQVEKELLEKAGRGYVYIKADGGTMQLDSMAECMRAAGKVNISFVNMMGALNEYSLSAYNEELTQDLYNIMMYSPNPELYAAYLELYEGCYQYYTAKVLAIDPKAVSAWVLADGSIKTYSSSAYGEYGSVTREIINEIKLASLKALDAQVTTDADYRLTGFNGSAEIEILDINDVAHSLEIKFELSAGDYNETRVNSVFNPEDYGWVTYEEYVKMNPEEPDDNEFDWEEFVKNAPDSITFAGKTYQTMIEIYRDDH